MFVGEKHLSSAYEEICIEYLHCTKYYKSQGMRTIERVAMLIETTLEVKKENTLIQFTVNNFLKMKKFYP